MIKHLFLDNYRGFSNTTVPLLDVNFLVGENSSGKTSLMDLLRIVASPTFFMGAGFGGNQEPRFGHFNEMVSAHSKDRSYFRIGLIEEREHYGDKKIKTTGGMLLTYKEASGIPKLKQLTYAGGNHQINLIVEGEEVLYNFINAPYLQTKAGMDVLLNEWKQGHTTSDVGWIKLKLQQVVDKAADAPLYALLHWVLDEQAKPNSRRVDYSMLYPRLGNQLVWIAPIRTKPRRTYDEPYTSFSSEGLHTPYVIRRMLSSKPQAEKFGAFMRRVGKESGLFHQIEIKRFGSPDDDAAPFEVDVVLDGKPLNLNWVGYGVSQSLPIFVELLDRPAGSWFAIQQPEVHLHPRAQASLGDVFFEMATKDSKRFVIETHSDFTIDRFRMNYRRRQSKLPASQILFFERIKSQNTVRALTISSRGELPTDQPDSYRDFFVKEDLRVLGI